MDLTSRESFIEFFRGHPLKKIIFHSEQIGEKTVHLKNGHTCYLIEKDRTIIKSKERKVQETQELKIIEEKRTEQNLSQKVLEMFYTILPNCSIEGPYPSEYPQLNYMDLLWFCEYFVEIWNHANLRKQDKIDRFFKRFKNNLEKEPSYSGLKNYLDKINKCHKINVEKL